MALHHILKNYHFRDVVRHLAQLAWYKQLLGLTFTLCSYLLLTLYDTIAVHAAKRPLPYRRIAAVSFIGYAFNNNFGFAGLAGNSLRYRIYTSWGLSTVEVAKVISYCVMAFWMGFLGVAGVVFIVDPMPLPSGPLSRNFSTHHPRTVPGDRASRCHGGARAAYQAPPAPGRGSFGSTSARLGRSVSGAGPASRLDAGVRVRPRPGPATARCPWDPRASCSARPPPG